MLKNDRMMLILTGLILAIFAGSMVQFSDKISALMGGDTVVATQDDSYSVRAGSAQILDVLSNDTVKGPIVVLSRPSCGVVELTGNNRISFSSEASCDGEVTFAYCVDSDGACAPNAVNINIISVNFAQENTTPAATPAPASRPSGNNASDGVGPAPAPRTTAPAPQDNAPEIEPFMAEMAPPALAAPSTSELVSPHVAVASIRQATTGLEIKSAADQNIATQNSATIGQTTSAGPSSFAAPEVGGASNISLGGSQRVVASAAPVTTGLQASSRTETNITLLERGPEALASVQAVPLRPATPDTAPLAASANSAPFTPVVVATAQTQTPTPDARFSAAPIDGGPIALIALNRAQTRGAGAGESLNIILTEPGLQGFLAPETAPAALAPVSAQPQNMSILHRGPTVAKVAPAQGVPAQASRLAVNISPPAQRSLQPTPTRTALIAPSAQPLARPAINLTPAETPAILQASLPATPDAPVSTTPPQNSTCEIALSAQVRSGATIQLDISAPCKPNQMVTITHSGLAFSVLTDAKGAATVQLPAMEANAEISARFEDQSESSTVVAVRGIENVVRAGVSWRADINLDLSATEFGAAIGSEGYISPATPRDYRTSRIKGGGYLVQLGDPSLGRGALAEVYTLPIARNQQRGTIALSITISDAANVCGQSITAKTVRTRDGRSAGIRNVRFTVPACGSAADQVILPGAIDDIRVAGR